MNGGYTKFGLTLFGFVLAIGAGFPVSADDTEIFYQISVPFQPELSRGIRWDDPEIGIDWPSTKPFLSDRDGNLPTLAEAVAAGQTAGGANPIVTASSPAT